MNPTILLSVGLALVVGGGVGFYIRQQMATKRIGSAEEKAEKIIAEAKAEHQKLLLEAKEKSLHLIEEAKADESSRRKEMTAMQARIEKRESLFDQKLLDLEKKQDMLSHQGKEVEKMKEEALKFRSEQMSKLEKIAGLSQAEAKQKLLEHTEKNMRGDIVARLEKISNEVSDEYENKIKDILATCIQRCSMSHVVETTTSHLELTSDEMKGRIIGKEGRNIKILEQLTGVEVLIDDTPQMITLSSFNPIRRQVAKVALQRLMVDGRINPAKIEDAVNTAKKEIAVEIRKAGEEAAQKAGVAGLDPKLISILGRLKYRTSYGQNILNHSIEVAHLSAMIAEYVGGDPNIARKGGLLHDIGKAIDQEMEGTHTKIGGEICRKFGLPEEVIKPVELHHDDNPGHLETIIVKVADAISGSRPGARRDSLEEYIHRLTELEKIATEFTGVDKAYAISAGREVRVFVKPTEVDDLEAFKMARDIANRIEESLKYPGEIKVNVIRETRVTEFAR